MSDAYVDRKVMEYLKAAKMDMPGYLTPGEIGWIKRGYAAALEDNKAIIERLMWKADELKELRAHHEACIVEAYKMFGMEDESELRMKWVLLEIANMQRQLMAYEGLLLASPPIGNCNTIGYPEWKKQVEAIFNNKREN